MKGREQCRYLQADLVAELFTPSLGPSLGLIILLGKEWGRIFFEGLDEPLNSSQEQSPMVLPSPSPLHYLH